MAKNFADLYASGNDSIALEQRVYLKEETTRGQLIAPVGTDFLFTIPGTSVNFTQPVESSPHRSGRHHVDVIKQKTSTEWSVPTLFNIDSSLGSAAVAEIDPAVRLLWKSLMGNEDTTGGFAAYNSESGFFAMASYRDPHIVATLGAFQGADDYIRSGDFTDEDIKEAVLQVCADIDKPDGRGQPIDTLR